MSKRKTNLNTVHNEFVAKVKIFNLNQSALRKSGNNTFRDNRDKPSF